MGKSKTNWKVSFYTTICHEKDEKFAAMSFTLNAKDMPFIPREDEWIMWGRLTNKVTQVSYNMEGKEVEILLGNIIVQTIEGFKDEVAHLRKLGWAKDEEQ